MYHILELSRAIYYIDLLWLVDCLVESERVMPAGKVNHHTCHTCHVVVALCTWARQQSSDIPGRLHAHGDHYTTFTC